MNETACEEDYRPQALQKAFRMSAPHLGRTSPPALTTVLGQQEEQLESQEMLELLRGHRPGTVVLLRQQRRQRQQQQHLLTLNYIKT